MAVKEYTYQPIILIGAGRSGTKIIRDVLGSHASIDTVPFDVNYIWRIGLLSAEDDMLRPEQLTPKNRGRIIEQLSRQSKGQPFLLEKTVSNCLRIPYILKVFPDAKFIHLIRDGRDVIESVQRQWGEARELSYAFKKLKTFPLKYAGAYLLEYGLNWMRFGLGQKGADDYIWGVKYPGYIEDLKNKTILEVCAHQWRICLVNSLTQLALLPHDKVLEVRYEDLVKNPETQLADIGSFIGIQKSKFKHTRLTSNNIGKYKKAFSPDDIARIEPILGPLLKQLKYT